MQEIKRKNVITWAEKLEILSHIESNKSISHSELALRYGVSKSTISKIKNDREMLQNLAKTKSSKYLLTKRKLKPCKNAALEKAILKWGKENHDKLKMFSWTLLQDKALEIAYNLEGMENFRASSGWLDRFRKRHCLSTYASFADVVLPNPDEEEPVEKKVKLEPEEITENPLKIPTETVPAIPGKITRNTLTLGEKVEIIRELIRTHGTTKMSDIAKTYSISHSCISTFWKHRDKYLAMAENKNHSLDHRRMKKIMPVDDPLVNWFNENRGKFKITRKMLQDKAREIAQELELEDFKASNGWLEKFLKRRKIHLKTRDLKETEDFEGSADNTEVSNEASEFLEEEIQIFDGIKEEPIDIFPPSQEELDSALEIIKRKISLTPHVPLNILESLESITSFIQNNE